MNQYATKSSQLFHRIASGRVQKSNIKVQQEPKTPAAAMKNNTRKSRMTGNEET
jgi:hypothetical protein